MRRFAAAAPFLFLALSGSSPGAEPAYECRWAGSPVTIDAQADEEAWKHAVVIDRFAMPWLKMENRAATTATRARLLWDREALYFHAEMDDADLFGEETQADGFIWKDDVFELFFKPARDKPGYYEFEVNVRNAVLDMFIPERQQNAYELFKKAQKFRLETKVELRGTLNERDDTDEGWSVEGRIPWTDFAATGGAPEPGEEWTFSLCRYDYSKGLDRGVELSTTSHQETKDFHAWEGYAPIRFVGPPKPDALREVGGVPTLKVAGSPGPPSSHVVERYLPDFRPSNLIYFDFEPGHPGRLLFIDRIDGANESRLRRLTIETGEIETLIEDDQLQYGFAFHPRFAENGYLYLGHNGPGTVPRPERFCRITRYTLDPKTGRFDPASGLSIIDWPSGGHDGAAMAFDSDGLLYVTTGDGTNGSDTDNKGQGLDHLLAKVLRIDVDRPADGKPYSVPKDNPFVEVAGARPETWAYGLRNPWRIWHDRESGQLWVGNNGQDLTEQIYLVERSANYGWSVYEGSRPFLRERPLGPTPVSMPTLEHGHHEARSLTGGLVYRGSKHPDLVGAYLYGDNSTGKIWAARHDGKTIAWHREIADTQLAITAFGLSPDGEVLIADFRPKEEGGLYRLVQRPAAAEPPPVFPVKLSETGLFRSVEGHEVEPTLLPFGVIAENWMDGAEAVRYLALPAGDPKIGLTPRNAWRLPEGTAVLQSIRSDDRWIESRILSLQDGEWAGYSYAWNEAQTDAELVPAEGRDIELGMGKPWRYPSRAECMICHSRAASFLLGLQSAQMNREFDYGDGVVANQIEMIGKLGLFREPRRGRSAPGQRTALAETAFFSKKPDQFDRLADPRDPTAPLDDRARAYLHANCAHCHVQSGGGNSEMKWQYATPLEAAGTIDQPPSHGDRGLGPEARVVKPGNPGLSVLVPRVASRGEGQMPPIGTREPDPLGVALLIQWISEMKADVATVEP